MGLLPNMSKFGLCASVGVHDTPTKNPLSRYIVLARSCAPALNISQRSVWITDALHSVSLLISPHPSPRKLSHNLQLYIRGRPGDLPTAVPRCTAGTHWMRSQIRCVHIFILFPLADNFQPRRPNAASFKHRTWEQHLPNSHH